MLPIRRAEELIATLPGVLSVRIVASPTGAVDEVHVLTTDAVPPKQTVRNIESAVMAQLGMRVNHRKISIATTLDPSRATDGARGGSEGAPLAAPLAAPSAALSAPVAPAAPVAPVAPAAPVASAPSAAEPAMSAAMPLVAPAAVTGRDGDASNEASRVTVGDPTPSRSLREGTRRLLLFEDVEVRRSRSRGAVCQVTVSRDGVVYTGESEGPDTDQSRLELTARAALAAVAAAASGVVRPERVPVLQGVRPIEAFERTFLFVVLQARGGRTPVVLTGTCEVRESPESSVVVAVLDATNRWLFTES